MVRLFKNLQIIRMFSKKKNFLQKIWGAQAPFGHQVAPPLTTRHVMRLFFLSSVIYIYIYIYIY